MKCRFANSASIPGGSRCCAYAQLALLSLPSTSASTARNGAGCFVTRSRMSSSHGPTASSRLRRLAAPCALAGLIALHGIQGSWLLRLFHFRSPMSFGFQRPLCRPNLPLRPSPVGQGGGGQPSRIEANTAERIPMRRRSIFDNFVKSCFTMIGALS